MIASTSSLTEADIFVASVVSPMVTVTGRGVGGQGDADPGQQVGEGVARRRDECRCRSVIEASAPVTVGTAPPRIAEPSSAVTANDEAAPVVADSMRSR